MPAMPIAAALQVPLTLLLKPCLPEERHSKHKDSLQAVSYFERTNAANQPSP